MHCMVFAMSDASQGEPSCLASGNFPFAKQSKLQCMISHMALMVGAPIILASKHVIGILQLEKTKLQGRLSVQKSTVLWFILPCTGTPSPNRPTGSMDHVEGPSCRKLVPSFWHKKCLLQAWLLPKLLVDANNHSTIHGAEGKEAIAG